MIAALIPAPSPSGTPAAGDGPSWADQLEAWSTLGGAVVALAAAIATIWLLVHQIGETRRARADAQHERDLATDDRREAERVQARTVVLHDVDIATGRDEDGRRVDRLCAQVTNYGTGPVLDVTVHYRAAGRRYLIGRAAVLGPGRPPLVMDLSVDVAAGDGGEAYVVVFFTDMAGRVWARRPDEQPVTGSAAAAHATGDVVDMLGG